MQPRDEVLSTPFAEHGGRLASLNTAAMLPECTDFSVCLNAYGPAPVVRDAVRNSSIDEYPDRLCRAPRHAASFRWDRPVEEIVFGAGATELIHAVCFAYLNRGDAVVVAQPCFGEYERAAQLCGATVHVASTVPGNDEIALWDGIMNVISTMLRTGARLVFLASPSSPAGGQYHPRMLQLLADTCRKCDCLLVLDQSYDAFADNPLGTPALPGHTHVVHLRSLTKDNALAGIRAAFIVAAPPIVICIERVRVPWAASNAAQAAASAAMTDEGLQHVTTTIHRLRTDAAIVAAHCVSRGFDVVPSSTHYLLIACESARTVRDRLHSEFGLLVRDCTSFGLPGHIRVAARTPSENAELLKAIDTLGADRTRTSASPSICQQEKSIP